MSLHNPSFETPATILGASTLKNLDKLTPKELIFELNARGVVPERLQGSTTAADIPAENSLAAQTLRADAIPLLRKLILAEQLSLKQGLPFIWTAAVNPCPLAHFSELVMHCHEGELLLVGPYFPAPKERPVIGISAMSLTTHEWRVIQGTGDLPNPFILFKRMPFTFIRGGKLYFFFSDLENRRFDPYSLDLTTYVWTHHPARGAALQTRDYFDAAYYEDHLYVLLDRDNHRGCEVMRMNLDEHIWRLVNCGGIAPSFINGGSIQNKEKLYLFSRDGASLYTLDLELEIWSSVAIKPLPGFQTRLHTHIMKVYNDQLLLVRKCDNFLLNVFDLATRTWHLIDTMGKRPDEVRTEASFVVHDDILYCLCGQTKSGYLLMMSLAPRKERRKTLLIKEKEGKGERERGKKRALGADKEKTEVEPPKKPLSWGEALLQGGLTDITFTLDDGAVILAHRCVMAGRNEFFKELLLGSMIEGRLEEIPIREISSRTFLAFIHYLYDILDLEREAALGELDFGELFMASSRFCCLDLQIVLAEFLIQNLDAETSLIVLRLFAQALPGFPSRYQTKVMDLMLPSLISLTHTPEFMALCRETPRLLQDILANATDNSPAAKKRRTAGADKGEAVDNLRFSFPLLSEDD